MALPDGPLTGAGVPRVGLGLAALGRPAYITSGRAGDLPSRRSVDTMEARTHDVLDAAWDAGVRYVDCARSYGLAERFLGSWLASHPGRRERLVVGSKWGYRYVGEFRMDAAVHEIKEHSVAMLDEQWPQTLEALSTLNIIDPGVSPRPYVGGGWLALPEGQDIATKFAQEVSAALVGSATVDEALEKANTMANQAAKDAGRQK